MWRGDCLPLAEAEVDETALTYEYPFQYWGDKIALEEAD